MAKCPWTASGRHIAGCGCDGSPSVSLKEKNRRGEQEAALNAQKDRVDKKESEKADKFLAKHVRSDTYTPDPYPGVTMERGRDGWYYYIRKQ